jgi:hypothetical protein
VKQGTDWLSRGLAIGAFLLSFATLGWGVLLFRLSGPRVKVSLLYGALRGNGLVTGPADGRFNWALLQQQGFTDPLLGIEVRNLGRISVEVRDYGARFTTGMGYSLPGFEINPQLPYPLQAQSSARWFVRLADLVSLAQAIRATGETMALEVGMEVQVLGQTVRTKKHVRVD